jgi:hypothetical protein
VTRKKVEFGMKRNARERVEVAENALLVGCDAEER